MEFNAIRSAAVLLVAAAPVAWADVPAATTGLCRDGTTTETSTRKGACAGHKGLKKWYGTRRGAPAAASEERAPLKPTQSIGSTAGGDRLNNTQPTDNSTPTRR